MEETKTNKKGKQLKTFEMVCVLCLIVIMNAYLPIDRINDRLDNKLSYSTEVLYFREKGSLKHISVENKQAGMPISIALKNSRFKGGTYKLSYSKNSDKDRTYVDNVTFDKRNETKLVNILKDAEAEQEYSIFLEKLNDGEGSLDANIFSK